jgi:hypothetical protein
MTSKSVHTWWYIGNIQACLQNLINNSMMRFIQPVGTPRYQGNACISSMMCCVGWFFLIDWMHIAQKHRLSLCPVMFWSGSMSTVFSWHPLGWGVSSAPFTTMMGKALTLPSRCYSVSSLVMLRTMIYCVGFTRVTTQSVAPPKNVTVPQIVRPQTQSLIVLSHPCWMISLGCEHLQTRKNVYSMHPTMILIMHFLKFGLVPAICMAFILLLPRRSFTWFRRVGMITLSIYFWAPHRWSQMIPGGTCQIHVGAATSSVQFTL